MKTIEILRGLPASGKSSYANKKIKNSKGKIKRINKDLLREMLDDSEWSKSNENTILEIRNLLIKTLIISGFDVIIDDTNLINKHVETIKDIAKELSADGFETKVIINDEFCDTPIEVCIQRDRNRKNSVGRRVILSMARNAFPEKYEEYHKHYEEYRQIETKFQDSNLPKAIMCDLDGTLALLNNRNPYDASNCDITDSLNQPVANILKMYSEKDYSIVLMSGRPNDFRESTIRFLEKHNVNYSVLHMRASGDSRKDSIVKYELYKENVEPYFNIELVLDDRDSVVDMWRKDLQLPTFQVNYGDF